MAKERFTVEPGRLICRDGLALFAVHKVEGVNPCDADELCHIIAALLNKQGDKPIKTTYLGGETLKLR